MSIFKLNSQMSKITATYNIDGVNITIKYKSKKDREFIEERIVSVIDGGLFRDWEEVNYEDEI